MIEAGLYSRFLHTKQTKWQARRDSNPQHPDLETGALAVRATGLHFIVTYFGPIRI